MSNTTNGILSGAGTGASIGTSIMPGWGTAIGAVAGGILGGVTGSSADDEEKKEKQKLQKQLQQQYQQGLITLDQYKTAMENATSAYSTALNNAYTSGFEEAGKIDFDKDAYNRDDYRKSNEGAIIEATKNNMKGENMGQGSSWGSGATGNILDAVVNQQEKLDEYADEQMNAQRDFDYKIASDEATNRLNVLKAQLDALGSETSLNTDYLNSYYSGLLGLQNTQNANANNASMYNLQNNSSQYSQGLSNIAQAGNAVGSILAKS